MKWVYTFLFLGCFSARVFGGAGTACTIGLLNGDRIRGTYLGQDRAFVLLQTEMRNRPLRIHGKYIDVLDFGKKERTAHADCQIQLSPAQQLLGNELKFDDGRMQFKTLWTEALILDRSYMQSVRAVPLEDKVIFRGPGTPEKWKYSQVQNNLTRRVTTFTPQVSGEWLLEGEGELSTTFPLINQGMGLRIGLDLPEMAPGDFLKVTLTGLPGTVGTAANRSGLIQFVLGHQRLTVEEVPVVEEGGPRFGQRKEIRGTVRLPSTGRFDFLLEVDHENLRYRVRAGDQIVAEWAMPQTSPRRTGYSPRLRFEWDLSSQNLTLKEVLLTLRDRPLPAESVEIPEDGEVVVFQNGDTLQAQWKGMDENGNWLLALPGLDSSTPIEPRRIQLWLNQGKDFKQMRRVAHHVELKLSGGEEQFIVELVDADKEAFTVQREGWIGRYRIPVSLIEQVKFNPYY